MSLVDKISRRINTSNVVGAVAQEFFPEVLSGFINEYLVGVTSKEFFQKVKEIEGKSLVNYLPPNSRQKLMGMVPEDVSWLTLEWFISEIQVEHPDIALLILSSNYVTSEVRRQIDLFKEECAR